MTFSIAARCRTSGRFAVAVASSSPAVAARCAYARAGVGAATTQNVTDPRLGPRALDLMALGASAETARTILAETAPHAAHRQLTMIDAEGRTAVFSGAGTLGIHGEAEGQDVVSAGNLLAHAGVPQAIVSAFEASEGQDLGDVPWPIADLRVDWHEAPIEELGRLWAVYQPQMDAYVTRALNPTDAPSYGVPGDE
jgi:uncharacterized Ntn-hydrolase superfamily protein